MDILMLLGGDLDKLRKEFHSIERRNAEDGIGIVDFRKVMRACMIDEANETLALDEKLDKLFFEVDHDGDKKVNWEEFSEHCVNVGNNATGYQLDEASLKVYQENRNLKDGCKHPTSTKWINAINGLVVCQSYTSNIRIYDASMKLLCDMDTGERKHEVSRQDKGNFFKVTATQSKTNSYIGARKNENVSSRVFESNSSGKKYPVIAVEFCPVNETQSFDQHTNINYIGTLVTASSDMCVKFWQVSQNVTGGIRISFINKVSKKLNSPQYLCYWCKLSKKLYTADDEGNISIWTVDINKGGNFQLRNKMKAHVERVTSIISSTRFNCVLTSSLDKSILIWRHGKVDCAYKLSKSGKRRRPSQKPILIGKLNGHQLGVRSMALTVDDTILVSVGFEVDVYCWCMEGKSLLCKLKGHIHPLISVKPLIEAMDTSVYHEKVTNYTAESHQHQQIITMDENGCFRIWVITYSYCKDNKVPCIQEFSPWAVTKPKSFTLIWPSNNLVYTGFRLGLFNSIPMLSEYDGQAACVAEIAYNRVTNTVACGINKTVWIWEFTSDESNILKPTKGIKLIRRFYEICKDEITSIEIDKRGKKLFIGTQKGKIQVHSYLNGTLLRNCSDHQRDVSRLCWLGNEQCLVSGSWDGNLRTYCELPTYSDVTGAVNGYEMKLARETGAQNSTVSILEVSRELSLIATASAGTRIYIWDFQTFNLESCCDEHTTEITAISFVGTYPIMISADIKGRILIWGVRPHSSMYGKPLYNLEKSISMTDITHLSIIALSDEFLKDSECNRKNYCKKNSYVMCIGNEEGKISTWNFSPVLDALGIQPVKDEKLPINRHGYNPRKIVSKKQTKLIKNTRDKVVRKQLDTSSKYSSMRIKHSNKQALLKPEIRRRKSTGSGCDAGPILSKIASWVGHNEPIMRMKVLHGTDSVLSSSADNLLKLWGIEGELLGIFSTITKFPTKLYPSSYARNKKFVSASEQTLESENAECKPENSSEDNYVPRNKHLIKVAARNYQQERERKEQEMELEMTEDQLKQKRNRLHILNSLNKK